MKIEKIRELENCFDGDFMKEILFASMVTRDFIDYLGKMGDMQYLSSLTRPFYKININDNFIIKGIEGNKTARVIFNRENISKSLKFFKKIIKKY